MGRFKDLTGQRFGRFTVIKRGENEYAGKDRQPKTTWICQCDCGNIKKVRAEHLRSGRVTNCGCWHEEKRKEREEKRLRKYEEKPQCTIHDKRLHNIFKGIKERCYTESCASYKNYGGRGIDMCEEWRKRGGFWAFRDWALANGYREDLTIDRIDNDKGYYPDNCRWATYKEQANNTRRKLYNIDGEAHTLKEWGEILGISIKRLYSLHSRFDGEEKVRECIAAAKNGEDYRLCKTANRRSKYTEEEREARRKESNRMAQKRYRDKKRKEKLICKSNGASQQAAE